MHGIWVNKAVFSCVSKVISELHWFCITSLSYWFKVLAPIVACVCTFSCALCRLCVITLGFDCFTGLSLSFLIDQSNYLVLVLRHLIETGPTRSY